MPQYRLGRKGVAYFNDDPFATLGQVSYSGITPGNRAAALALWDTWFADGNLAVAGNITDVAMNLIGETADGTTREIAAWDFTSEISVIKGGTISFESRWKGQTRLSAAFATPYTFMETLIAAWNDDEPIAMAFLDQTFAPTATGTYIPTGLAAMFNVQMDVLQPIRDIQRTAVTLSIADAPLWYEASVVVP